MGKYFEMMKMENFKEKQMRIIEKHSRCWNMSHPAVLVQLPTVDLSQDSAVCSHNGTEVSMMGCFVQPVDPSPCP